jgi:sRNA-binding protein
MPKYTALTPVKHDGKRYAVGASIDLSKAEADRLPAGTVELPRADDSAARKAAEKAEAARKAQEEAEAAQKVEADRLAAEKAAADLSEAAKQG